MKYFRDAVHGRIPVAEEYCKYIIDTLQFQRLKRIEQTSMRDLYPSAHHDRFIHSIGTYYIGQMMGEQIKNNNFAFNDLLNKANILNSEEKNKINSVIKNFEVACLLHDCGHAPFSHTFENCFKHVETYEQDTMEVVIKYIARQICAENNSYYRFEEIETVLNEYIILNKSAFDQKVRRYLIGTKQLREELDILKDLKEEFNEDIETFYAYIEDKEKELESINRENKQLIESVYSDFGVIIKERFIKFKNNKRVKKLFALLLEYFIDSAFESPKPHEIISAWLVLHEKGFGRILQDTMHLDPLLIARMICGYKYNKFDKLTYCDDRESDKKIKEILNCFISLLNGKVIDADKLDYCLRDKWASGVNVNNIEIRKLLQSLSIRENTDGDLVVCFNKGAIPEIESVIDSKNKVAYWCHNHHKIVYRQELLKNAVEKLAVVFAPKKQREEYQHLKRCRHELLADCHEKARMNVYDKDWHFVGSEQGCYSLEDYYSRPEIESKYLTVYDFIKIRRGTIEQDNIGKIFNYHSFVSPQIVDVQIGDSLFRERLLLVSDDDIICLLKKYLLLSDLESYAGESDLEKEFRSDASKYVKDLLSRNQDLIPLWKSRTEFLSDFENLIMPVGEATSEENLNKGTLLLENIENKLGEAVRIIKTDVGKKLDDENMPCRVICRSMTVAGISSYKEVFIDTGGNNVCCYTTLDLLPRSESANIDFVYAYVPKVRKCNSEKESTWSKIREIYVEILNDIKS